LTASRVTFGSKAFSSDDKQNCNSRGVTAGHDKPPTITPMTVSQPRGDHSAISSHKLLRRCAGRPSTAAQANCRL
jgi:hypothetical protein